MTVRLVDTSVWVAFFRGDPKAVEKLDRLLEQGDVATTGPVFAEVVSGARERRTYDRLRDLFQGLLWLSPPVSCWERVGELRFTLAKRGVQAHLVDLLIASTAAEHGCPLVTRDKDFQQIAVALPSLELESF